MRGGAVGCMDRAEAIEAIEAKGLYAKRRAWNLGDSIFVGTLPSEPPGDIKVYEVGLWLYPDPHDDAVWWMTDFRAPSPDIKCGSLEEAVEIGTERVIAEARRIESKRR